MDDGQAARDHCQSWAFNRMQTHRQRLRSLLQRHLEGVWRRQLEALGLCLRHALHLHTHALCHAPHEDLMCQSTAAFRALVMLGAGSQVSLLSRALSHPCSMQQSRRCVQNCACSHFSLSCPPQGKGIKD